jgi:hypothetical protein
MKISRFIQDFMIFVVLNENRGYGSYSVRKTPTTAHITNRMDEINGLSVPEQRPFFSSQK